MKKIMFTILLCCLAMLPSTALANAATNVEVGGKVLNETNKYAYVQNGNVTTDASVPGTDYLEWDGSGTLTVHGNVEFTCDTDYGIDATGDLTITGTQADSLTVTGGSTVSDMAGICVDGGLTVSGVSVKATGKDISASTGIAYSSGVVTEKITVQDGGILSCTGGAAGGASAYSYGVSASAIEGLGDNSTGTIIVDGGTLNAYGGTAGASSAHSYGVLAKSIIIQGGGVMNCDAGNAKGTDEADAHGVLLYYDSDTSTGSSINVKDGMLSCMGGEATGAASSYSYGAKAYYITMNGGSFTGRGGTAANSYGMYADNSITLSGGTTIANGNTAAFNIQPAVSGSWYKWRTDANGEFTSSETEQYIRGGETYAEIQPIDASSDGGEQNQPAGAPPPSSGRRQSVRSGIPAYLASDTSRILYGQDIEGSITVYNGEELSIPKTGGSPSLGAVSCALAAALTLMKKRR